MKTLSSCTHPHVVPNTNYFLSSEEHNWETSPFGFGTTWERVKDDRHFIFGWTSPLKLFPAWHVLPLKHQALLFSSFPCLSFALSVFGALGFVLFLHFILLFVLVLIPHLLLLLLLPLFSAICIVYSLTFVLHLSVLHFMFLSPGLLPLLLFGLIFLHVWSAFATPHLFRDALSPSPWGFIIHPSLVLFLHYRRLFIFHLRLFFESVQIH